MLTLGVFGNDFGLRQPSRPPSAGAWQDLACVQVPLLTIFVSFPDRSCVTKDRFASFTRELVDRGKRVVTAER
jgi:hypothetical protein